MNYTERITIEAGKRGGKPCVRGMRITVFEVLEYLASGMSIEEILEDFPYLEKEDILACLALRPTKKKLNFDTNHKDEIVESWRNHFGC